ncbi:DUF2235 domain-containing protein [Puniceicoccaceae bacterium K14]|nr:DUF2235 domain-containing protein [Puniceicoccaceae bacterium K14]
MKRIIVCCDGTWNDLEMRYITNVGRLAQSLEYVTADGVSQVLYYDNGIGADSKGLMKYIDGGLGKGMDANIAEAYRFICINYEDGDEICLFGFSRGAYTVRSLAGMIGKAGLVGRVNLKQIPRALEVYRGEGDAGEFRRKYGKDVPIALLGCWDTVGALGIPDKVPWLPFDNWSKRKYQFHDTDLGKNVKCALHAVSIDDRRKEFDVTLMNKAQDAPSDQILRQVWFPGVHGCIGGGIWEKRGLSNAALVWMLEEAEKMGIKLAVDFNRLADKAESDYSIYFDGSVEMLYGEHDRKIVGSWSDIHDSAKLRWKELPDYRPVGLKRFATRLKRWNPSDLKKPLPRLSRLRAGASADVRVWSSKKANSSKLKVKNGESYRIIIPGTQAWKDGKLDACDIRGWSLRAAKPAWQKGEEKKFNAVERRAISSFKKKCPVRQADFFELIAKIGKGEFFKLSIPNKADTEGNYVVSLKASRDGELIFAANDVSSKWDFFDQYDNNKGWVWLKVERID